MTQISSVPEGKEWSSAEVVVVPVWAEGKKPRLDAAGEAFASLAKFPLQQGDFLAKEGEALLLYGTSGKPLRVLLVGLGKKEGAVPDTLRRAYATSVKSLRVKHLKSAHFLFPKGGNMGRQEVCIAVIEGVLLANYAFDGFKTEDTQKTTLQKVCFCGLNKEEGSLLKKLEIVVEAVDAARDLVNGNADDIDVLALSRFAKGLASNAMKVSVFDKKRLEKEKMGLLLAVGRGAAQDPALVILEYRGDPKSKKTVALVGKGITYDTGGLNLKPTGSMETMKCDMAGTACVLGVMQAAQKLKLKKNLIGVLAMAENAMGPLSYKPGDVYRSHAGKTVEISNTDAEGRLVLADAISYVQKAYAPTQIIDIATLTGGVVIALGEEATGLFSNDAKLAEQLKRAGDRTHERVWQLPLYPEYKELLKSSIADFKNSGARKASAAQGAIFLEQFIDKTPWAHLDIAGTGYLSDVVKPYHPTPATGVGVRLLIDFLEHLDAP